MKINKIIDITDTEYQVQFQLMDVTNDITNKYLIRMYTIKQDKQYQLIGEYPINLHGETTVSLKKDIFFNHHVIVQVCLKNSVPTMCGSREDILQDECLQLIINHNDYCQDNRYCKTDGNLARLEWLFENKLGNWVYFDEDGYCSRNQWIQGYYLKSDGQLARNEWFFDRKNDCWFCVGENGHKLVNQWKDGIFLRSNGEVAKDSWIFDSDCQEWFYVDGTGHYVQDCWIGDYYLDFSGKMAKNKWIHDGKGWRYVKENGCCARDEIMKGHYIPKDGYLTRMH